MPYPSCSTSGAFRAKAKPPTCQSGERRHQPPSELLPPNCGRARLSLNDLVTNGVANQRTKRFQPQFFHDRGAMRFHRTHTNPQDDGNFLTTFTLTQKLHDFPLPIGDPAVFGSPFERLFSLNTPRENDLRDPRCKKMFVLGKCFDRVDQMISRICFHDVATCSGVEDIVN